jgi:GMP reductase
MQNEVLEEYGFQEVYLLHNKCIVESRSQCDTSVMFGGRKFKTPVVAANMRSVVNENTCKYFAKNGWFYIMHRFGTDNYSFTNNMHDNGFVSSISIGVNDDSYESLKKMKKDNVIPEYITLDIANAYSVKAENMIKFVKDNFSTSFLIVGNYATEEAVLALEEWGADATKAGLSQGSVCSTYFATSVGRPMFSTVLKCAAVAKKPIIADGSVTCPGDITKAIVAGASMVMCGNLFAGYDLSAGEKITIEKESYKQYFGSASYNNTLNDKNVEGVCVLVKYRGEMDSLLSKIEDGLKSSISYAGGLNISSIRNMRWGIRKGGVRS